MIAGNPRNTVVAVVICIDTHDRGQAGGPTYAVAGTAGDEARVGAIVVPAIRCGVCIHFYRSVGGSRASPRHGSEHHRYSHVLVVHHLLVAETEEAIVCCAAVIDNGQTEVAVSVVMEVPLVELEIVPAIGGEVERPHIDQLQLAVWHKRRVVNKHVGTVGVGQIDGAVGGVGHGLILGVVIVEGDAADCCWPSSGYLRSKKELLAVAIIVATAERDNLGGRGTGVAQGNGVGGRADGVNLGAGKSLCVEIGGAGRTDQSTTVGLDRHPIERVGAEVGQQYLRVAGVGADGCGDGVAGIAVGDIKAYGAAEFDIVIPCQKCRRGGSL